MQWSLHGAMACPFTSSSTPHIGNSRVMTDKDILIEREGAIEPREIMALRAAVDWGVEDADVWSTCLRQSLCVVSARELATNDLIGVGFLVGNARHAQLVDMVVHPRFQRRGLARRLQQERIDFALANNIRYLSLTWDASKPWLRAFYESMGFRQVDNAMWHETSLDDRRDAQLET